MRPNLAEVAAEQHGVFTWQQALTAYTRTEIHTRLRRGDWTRVFRGVFREASTPRTALLLLDAARLSTGARSVAACRDTAAQLHGFAVIDDPNVHVLASDARMTRRSGLIVHRDQVSDGDLVVVRGALGTHAARTAIDLARTYNRLDALAVLDLALRRGTTREQLLVELEHHTGKRGVRQAKELVQYASPLAESPMESRTRMRCIDAGLPHPEPQVLVSANGAVQTRSRVEKVEDRPRLREPRMAYRCYGSK